MEECNYPESRFETILVIDSDKGKIVQDIDLNPILFIYSMKYFITRYATRKDIIIEINDDKIISKYPFF